MVVPASLALVKFDNVRTAAPAEVFITSERPVDGAPLSSRILRICAVSPRLVAKGVVPAVP